MGGDARGNDSNNESPAVTGFGNYSAMNPADRQMTGSYTAKNPITGRNEIRTPVFGDDGFQVGYTSDNPFPSVSGGVMQALTGEKPQVYTGDSRYDPFANQGNQQQNVYNLDGTVTKGNFNNTGGGSNNPRQPAVDPFAAQKAELAAARANRATALANKQAELTAAFSSFGDDFYDDLASSYSDYQNPLLAQSYDDSLRGIYEGFKAKGLLTQSGLDSAIGGLDAAKAAEMARITQGASDYSGAKRTEITQKQQKLGDQLAALVGGATTAADVNAQTDAINAFDFGGDVDKLKTPAAKGNLDFFQGFDKVTASAQPSQNVQPVSATGAPQAASITPAAFRTGIQSPYQGESLKVIS